MGLMTRRKFVATASDSACACILCPRVVLAASKAGPVAAGTLKDYPKDGIYDKWAKTDVFFIVRHKGRLFAASSLCTHKNAVKLVRAQDEQQIVCPKHGSRFTESGAVTRGPARRSLPRHAISADQDGKLTVDTSVKYEQDKWDEPGSFVKIV